MTFIDWDARSNSSSTLFSFESRSMNRNKFETRIDPSFESKQIETRTIRIDRFIIKLDKDYSDANGRNREFSSLKRIVRSRISILFSLYRNTNVICVHRNSGYYSYRVFWKKAGSKNLGSFYSIDTRNNVAINKRAFWMEKQQRSEFRPFDFQGVSIMFKSRSRAI